MITEIWDGGYGGSTDGTSQSPPPNPPVARPDGRALYCEYLRLRDAMEPRSALHYLRLRYDFASIDAVLTAMEDTGETLWHDLAPKLTAAIAAEHAQKTQPAPKPPIKVVETRRSWPVRLWRWLSGRVSRARFVAEVAADYDSIRKAWEDTNRRWNEVALQQEAELFAQIPSLFWFDPYLWNPEHRPVEKSLPERPVDELVYDARPKKPSMTHDEVLERIMRNQEKWRPRTCKNCSIGLMGNEKTLCEACAKAMKPRKCKNCQMPLTINEKTTCRVCVLEFQRRNNEAVGKQFNFKKYS